jgi:hypothetical protein
MQIKQASGAGHQEPRASASAAPRPLTNDRIELVFLGTRREIEQRTRLRQSHGRPIGHTTIRAQLGWRACEGVRNAIFTHCGSGIVGGDARRVGREFRRLAREQGVAAAIAHDGLAITLPFPRRWKPGALP